MDNDNQYSWVDRLVYRKFVEIVDGFSSRHIYMAEKVPDNPKNITEYWILNLFICKPIFLLLSSK